LQNKSQQFILLQKLIEMLKKKLKSMNGLKYTNMFEDIINDPMVDAQQKSIIDIVFLSYYNDVERL